MSGPEPPPQPASSQPSSAFRASQPRPVRALASAVLTWIAAGAALVLGLALFGLLPARAPAPVRTIKLDVEKATERPRLTARARTPPAHRLSLWSFPLCPRPRAGAKLVRVALRPERDAFLVWCQNEFLLFDVDAREPTAVETRAAARDADTTDAQSSGRERVPAAGGHARAGADPRAEALQVTRLARFPARAELPGGAAALDLDRDGVLDLVLGVAPEARAVHRSFSGVFWLRGRAQGGYELPRALVEMPPAALGALDLDGEPGAELVVLTRGDPAAQRPGELWIFTGGPSPKRAAVLPAALAPNDLALAIGRDGAAELWVVSAQPGSVLRVQIARTHPAEDQPADAGEARGSTPARAEAGRARESKPSWTFAVARTELPLRGAQAFLAGPRGEGSLYVRDVLSTYRVESEPAPKLTPWIEDARVGPSAWFDADGDHRPELVGVSEGGFVWIDGASGTRRERALPGGVRVLDASSITVAGAPRGVLLVAPEAEGAHLALVVLPSELRAETAELELVTGSVAAAPGEARAALE